MIERATFGGIAVTAHHLASSTAIDVLRTGGNAVDAAIAANAVLGVIAPETCGIGGDLFALIHEPGQSAPSALNASGRAGSGWHRSRIAGFETLPLDHPLTVTIPGCVDGWAALSSAFGALPWGDLLAPAVEIAAGGFAASLELAEALQRRHEQLRTEDAAEYLYPGGTPPSTRQRLTRPRLAATLQRIAEEGRSGFYDGTVGQSMTAATDSAIAATDLARAQSDWVTPLSATVFGLTGWTIPPNSQGYLTLAAASILEQCDPPWDPMDPEFVHLAIEAFRAVAWERDDVVADPGAAIPPPAWFLNPDRLAARASSISRTATSDWPAAQAQIGGTTFLCVVDDQGLGISLIQSNFHGIGSGIGVDGHGFLLHNRGAGFSLIPGHPNELRPHHRPLHTLSPTLWTNNDDLALLMGTRGGHQQPQLLLQLAAHILGAGAEPAVAQELPRWAMSQFSAGAPSRVRVESRMSSEVVGGLERRGHDVTKEMPWLPGWGPAAVIRVAGDGLRIGAADPRVVTSSTAI